MLDTVNMVLVQMINFLFGPIMLCVYFGVGILMTIRLKGVQFRRFGTAFRECIGNIGRGKNADHSEGQIKSFKALATALSSCVGNGNIVGIAGAIAVGGPGAIFWMWIAAILGMATKFSEICLAMHYRVQDEEGNFRGGVMYILTRGMKNKTIGKILGGAFAVFTVMVSLISCGSLQANTIASALGGGNGIGIPLWAVAVIILVLDALVVCGGLKKITNVTTFLTPFMSFIYMGFGLVIILMNAPMVPRALFYIVKSAFTGDAAVGGVAGATMMFAIQKGVSRGVFSNEAGIGSSAIVHATAKVDQPTRQSLYGIIEVFFDTIVIGTFTALIVMTTGVWNCGVTDGTELAAMAFQNSLGRLGIAVMLISLTLFCISTIFGWYTYGESAFTFLFGAKSLKVFRVFHCVICASGALLNVTLMWNLADVANGLMALPNLFSLFLFGGVVVKNSKEFFEDYDRKRQEEKERALL